MKTLSIIGASYLQQPLVEKAKKRGLRTICFAWRDGAVCKSLVDKFYPISIVDKEKILKICEQEKIDGICTIASDVAAPTVAYVAEQMGLCGNSYQSSLKAHDKALMRQSFAMHQIPSPWFRQVADYDEIKSETLKFPLIVKPTDRSGSLGVTKVNSSDDLKTAIQTAVQESFSKQAMVEQFVEGHEISVEFISFHGQHFPLTITDKVTTNAPHFVELEHHQPSFLPNDLQNKIYKTTSRALDALGVTNGASHTEYRITSDNDIYIIELGARMGGDFIGSDLVRLSTGYDFVKGVIDVALNQFEKPILSERHHAGVYFLCKETERLKPIIENYKKYPEIVQAEITNSELRNITCSAERSGYFIYQGKKKFKIYASK